MLTLHVHTLLLTAIVIGIGSHRRWQAALAFVAYVLVALANNAARAMGLLAREDWFIYLSVQLVQRVLALLVAVEVGARIFEANLAPTGRAYTQRVVLLVLLAGLVAAIGWGHRLGGVRTDAEVYDALIDAERRVAGTAMWTFLAVIAAAQLRFRWPIDPYHRDVSAGFVAYLGGVFLFSPDPDMPFQLPTSWPVWLYTAVLLLWLWAAWRRDDFSHVAPRFRRLVFPWARHDG